MPMGSPFSAEPHSIWEAKTHMHLFRRFSTMQRTLLGYPLWRTSSALPSSATML